MVALKRPIVMDLAVTAVCFSFLDNLFSLLAKLYMYNVTVYNCYFTFYNIFSQISKNDMTSQIWPRGTEFDTCDIKDAAEYTWQVKP